MVEKLFAYRLDGAASRSLRADRGMCLAPRIGMRLHLGLHRQIFGAFEHLRQKWGVPDRKAYDVHLGMLGEADGVNASFEPFTQSIRDDLVTDYGLESAQRSVASSAPPEATAPAKEVLAAPVISPLPANLRH